MQLVTLVSFLTSSLPHWRNRWTNCATLHTWRSGGSVKSDSIFFFLFFFEATKALVSSLVLSRLDYCTALLAGSPQVLHDKIQKVINCSARLTFKVPKSAYITPFLYDLHWLPVSSRIQYKIALICFHVVSGTAPPYLSELLHLYSSSRSVRSAADTGTFRVPRMGRRTLGERSFQYIGSVIWNSLPLSVRHSSSLSSFKSKLKTHLLSSTYWSVVLPIHHQ